MQESEDGVASLPYRSSAGMTLPLRPLVVSAPVTRLAADSAERIAPRLRDHAHRLTDLISPRAGL